MKAEIQENNLKIGSFDFLILKPSVDYNYALIMASDAVVIDSNNPFFVIETVKYIRSYNQKEVYLKPIYHLKSSSFSSLVVNELIDGTVFNVDQLSILLESLKDLYLKINEVKNLQSVSFEAEIIAKMANFMFTRDIKKMEPSLYPGSSICYIYPIVSINFAYKEEYNILKVLELAENEGIIKGEFLDRIYQCPNCSNGQHNYREVCPNCGSSHSETEDLIHHFPCAYVGPLSDFQNSIDEDLNCPKCNKTLRHIGVDYDKPSLLHTCQQCSHQYQDYHVKAKCMSCFQDNPIESLMPRPIKTYYLTRKGKGIPLNGLLNTSKDIEEIEGTVTFKIFKIMLKYEIERLKQNDYTSNIGYVHISNAGELYSKIGIERQKSLVAEMIKILRVNLRSSDFISFYDASTLILSMNEIPNKIAQKILRDICSLSEKLIKKNFRAIEVNFEYHTEPLDTDLSHELQVQRLLSNIVKDAEE